MSEPENREDTGRNPDGTFKPGVSGNPGGRPRNTLKDYLRRKINDMSQEEMEEFLKQVPMDLQWKMAEGNPHNETDITTGGDKIMYMPSEMLEKHGVPSTTEDDSEGQA